MIIGVLKEPDFENRVALLPDSVQKLIKSGHEIYIETEAGLKAFATDHNYLDSGGKIESRAEIFNKSELIVSIHPMTDSDIEKVNQNQVVVGMYQPLNRKDIVDQFLAKNLTMLSLDNLPRTTRAQAMDVLSSMATVAGYKAVLTAANMLPGFFPMFMSAAGTIKPSRMLILGAGVAGLQAIGTARKLGAVVEVFDVRSAVKEEVESLGGKFIEVEGATDDKGAGGYAVEQTEEFKQKQKQMIHDHAVKADVIITTAQIPGRDAPKLITKNTIENMKPGSVIIDIAASGGGNTELTQNNQTIKHNGVTILGDSLLPSTLAKDASLMFGNNIINFLKILTGDDGSLNLNFDDEIIEGCTVTHMGNVVSERVKNHYKL